MSTLPHNTQSTQKPKRKWGRYLVNTGLTFGLILGVGVASGAVYVQNVLADTPTVTKEALSSDPSTNIYDKDNNLIWSSAKNRRIYVTYNQLPEQYIKLLLAVEDQDFYQNLGFSPKGVINAVASYGKALIGQGKARGGSSIEQQLIKLSVFSTENEDKTIDRKIKEFFLANQLYQNYSKQEILELYVNKIYMGQGVYGVGTIAKVYYNKELNELSLAQLATLAGIGQAPSDYDLYQDPNAVKNRRDTVLEVAKNIQAINQEEYDQAMQEPIDQDLQPQDWWKDENYQNSLQYDAYISSTLEEIKALGYDIEKTPMQIHTHLDKSLNDYLKDLYDNHPEYFQGESQSAISVVDNQTGGYVAQIGGRNIKEPFGFNRATNRNRSTGSTIKPFVVGTAYEFLNYPSGKLISSAPYQYPNSQVIAKNYDGVDLGDVTISQALKESLNTPMLRLLELTTPSYYKAMLQNVGLPMDHEPLLPEALGINASTADMASAYSVIANKGVKKENHYIKSLTFSDGSVKQLENKEIQAMKNSTAYMLNQTLTQIPKEDGPFKLAYVEDINYGAKTGTVDYPETSDYYGKKLAMDLWTVGYTNRYSFAIWHGFDEPMVEGQQLSEESMREPKANLFKAVLEKVYDPKDNQPMEKPDTIQEDNENGLKPLDTPSPLAIKNPLLQQTLTELYGYYLGDKTIGFSDTKLENQQQPPQDYQPQAWKTALESEKQSFQEKIKKLSEDFKNRLDQRKRQLEIERKRKTNETNQ